MAVCCSDNLMSVFPQEEDVLVFVDFPLENFQLCGVGSSSKTNVLVCF